MKNAFAELSRDLKHRPSRRHGPCSTPWGETYSAPTNRIDSPWQYHEVGLLAYRTSGLKGFRTPDTSIILSPDMVLYIPPGVVHRENTIGMAVTGIFLILPKELTTKLPKSVAVYRGGPALLELFEEIVEWGNPKVHSPSQRQVVQTLIHKLKRSRQAKHLHIPVPKRPCLLKVARSILRQPEDMKGIDHWAREAQLPRRSFTRHFAQDTGVSFAVWKQRVKLYVSLKLLTDGTKVADTAHKLGYKNPSTFIAIFGKEFGQTPVEYLRNAADQASRI